MVEIIRLFLEPIRLLSSNCVYDAYFVFYKLHHLVSHQIKLYQIFIIVHHTIQILKYTNILVMCFSTNGERALHRRSTLKEFISSFQSIDAVTILLSYQ